MKPAANTRERWDIVGSRFYRLPRGGSTLPRITLHRYSHVCPDGTRIDATAQFIATVGVTIYRFRHAGQHLCHTTAVGPPTVEPDWGLFDSSVGGSAA
jgi:hypothetical protein